MFAAVCVTDTHHPVLVQVCARCWRERPQRARIAVQLRPEGCARSQQACWRSGGAPSHHWLEEISQSAHAHAVEGDEKEIILHDGDARGDIFTQSRPSPAGEGDALAVEVQAPHQLAGGRVEHLHCGTELVASPPELQKNVRHVARVDVLEHTARGQGVVKLAARFAADHEPLRVRLHFARHQAHAVEAEVRANSVSSVAHACVR